MSDTVIPVERIERAIYLIRGQKVMLDRDLAALYGVETKRLKEQVRRNAERFPNDFMFVLSDKEFANWRSHFATSNAGRMGLRHAPMAFTEQGVAMLSSQRESTTESFSRQDAKTPSSPSPLCAFAALRENNLFSSFVFTSTNNLFFIAFVGP